MKGLIKRLAIYSVIMMAVIFSVVGLYDTYATDLLEKNKSYAFTLSGDSVVSVEPLSSKNIYYQVKSEVNGTVRYGVAYSNVDGIMVKAWEGYDATGYLKPNDTLIVKLKITNTSLEEKETTISTILGYENGGDLIVDNNRVLVSDNPIIYNVNTLVTATGVTSSEDLFLNGLNRNQIESIEFVDDNIPPKEAIESFDVCREEGRESGVKLWYVNGETEGLYKVYIGSESGIVTFPEYSRNLFSNLINLKEIKFDYVNTSYVRDASSMFKNDSRLSYLDLSNFNTRNFQNLSGFLYNCISLNEINFDNFDISNVTDMSDLFYSCESINEINLNSFNTSKVTTMKNMFYGCVNLKEIDLSNFDISNVKDISGIFTNSSATKINISNFDFNKFDNVTNAFDRVAPGTEIIVSDCTQYKFMKDKLDRVDNVKTIKGLSTECIQED